MTSDFDKFIYLISHDVGQCARALSELPEWVREDLNEYHSDALIVVESNLTLMTNHARRLTQMLEDLLVFSRIGRVEKDLVVTADELVLGMREALDRYGHTYKLECKVEGSTAFPDTIKMVSEALLSNIEKHCDRCDTQVVVEISDVGQDVRFEFRDNGCGIPAEHHSRVFEPMTTLRPRDEVEGSGMGLAISKKVIELFGKEIALGDGIDGGGLGVFFTVPRRETISVA